METTIEGKTWANPREILSKVYVLVNQKIRSHELGMGDVFYFPELAQDLKTNHYYLNQHHLLPDHFKIVPDPTKKHGFSIHFHVEELPSEDKYRELEIQKNDNFTFQRNLLLRGLQEKTKEFYEQWINQNPQCNACQKTENETPLVIFFEDFDLEEELDHQIDLFPKSVFRSAVAYNFEESGLVQLNTENNMVSKILKNMQNATHLILCPACNDQKENDAIWQELLIDSTSEHRIVQILRLIAKEDSEEQVNRLLTHVQPYITHQEMTIHPHIQRIWGSLHLVIKDLIAFPKMEKIMGDLWEIWQKSYTDYTPPWWGLGFCSMLYRLDSPEWNPSLFSTIFHSALNLFSFFRVMGMEAPNSDLIAWIKDQSSAIDPDSSDTILDSYKSAMQGILYTKQKPLLDQIFRDFHEFPPLLQQTIIDETFNNSLHPYMEQLHEIFKLATEDTFATEITDFYSERNLDFERQKKEIDYAEKQEKKVFNRELEAVEKEYDIWQNARHKSGRRMEEVAGRLVAQKYRPLIEQHIENYRREFTRFFQNHSDALVGLDIEEWSRRMFLVMAIEIRPDLKVYIKMMCVEDIFPIERFTPPLKGKIRGWLKSVDTKYVINHGGNDEEAAMIRDSGHEQLNTQDILHKARFMNATYAKEIQGEGLKSFEDFIHFQRVGCPFLKHEIPIQAFYHETLLSLHNHLQKRPQRTCGICNKEQDVVLYCLEDAFSAILIEVYFANHEPQMVADL